MSQSLLVITRDSRLAQLAEDGRGGDITVTVTTAPDALESSKPITADLILLDQDQPEDFTAFQLMRSMQAAGSSVPVIGLVSRDDLQDVLAFVRLGAKDVLRKPIRPVELRGVMRRYLEKA